MTRGKRIILIALGVAVAGGIGGFFAIGGTYGLWALMDGHNPLKLTPASDEGKLVSQRRMEAIVAALETFRHNEGRYPARLEDLTPAYLPTIEQPTIGDRRWGYSPMNDGEVVLDYFIGPLHQRQWWSSKDDAWAFDYRGPGSHRRILPP